MWHCIITVEAEASHSVDLMEDDFNLVPIVRNLKENCKLDDAMFLTSDAKNCNILFNLLDENDK